MERATWVSSSVSAMQRTIWCARLGTVSASTGYWISLNSTRQESVWLSLCERQKARFWSSVKVLILSSRKGLSPTKQSWKRRRASLMPMLSRACELCSSHPRRSPKRSMSLGLWSITKHRHPQTRRRLSTRLQRSSKSNSTWSGQLRSKTNYK